MACETVDVLIIGGGFFGLFLAEHYARTGHTTLVLEREKEAMTRASFANQARVHNGYHYPRSLLTAYRSKVNYPRFREAFRPAIVENFRKLYAIPRLGSKVSSRQFRLFMERIGAPIVRAQSAHAGLFDPRLVDMVFEVEECAFDAVVLRRLALERLDAAGGRLACGTVATFVGPAGDRLRVRALGPDGEREFQARLVLNTTYSALNGLNRASGLPLIPLKHELTELALTEVPSPLQNLGITVMCGPFFSIMPFPPRGLHAFSHVRYTPHCSWRDQEGQPLRDADQVLAALAGRSRFPHMMRDAARYLPLLRELVYRDSLWEVKTILPVSDVDDSRPILFKSHHHLENYVCLVGGKIDNVFDAAAECRSLEGVFKR
jgi:glycine/D-amino acid oxidase-like deaminating enzyme